MRLKLLALRCGRVGQCFQACMTKSGQQVRFVPAQPTFELPESACIAHGLRNVAEQRLPCQEQAERVRVESQARARNLAQHAFDSVCVALPNEQRQNAVKVVNVRMDLLVVHPCKQLYHQVFGHCQIAVLCNAYKQGVAQETRTG